jgi:hypothetical protein
MTLDEFVSQGWQDHAAGALGVMNRFSEGVSLVSAPEHLPSLSALVVHVAGEHLGRWSEGIALLQRLETSPVFDAATAEGKSVLRSKAILHRCAGEHAQEDHFAALSRTGGDRPEASDRIRILSVAAAALLGQKQIERARADLEEAVALAAYGPTKDDPAARALAVTANNLAVELEERPDRSPEERALMLRSAEIARKFWLIAGGWMEHERAEYRLAMSNLKAGNAAAALAHAEACLRIVEENGGDPGEEFFAREALSRAQSAAGDATTARRERDAMTAALARITDDGFRGYCVEELTKLDALLARS